jgi:hypothetical protein
LRILSFLLKIAAGIVVVIVVIAVGLGVVVWRRADLFGIPKQAKTDVTRNIVRIDSKDQQFPEGSGNITVVLPIDGQNEFEYGFRLPRISLDDLMWIVAEQTGMEFDREESFKNIGRMRYTPITSTIENMTPEDAMAEILAKTNVTYRIEGNRIILESKDDGKSPTKRPVYLNPPYISGKQPDDGADRISIQYAVMSIDSQAGFGYAFQQSLKNTAPDCWEWIYSLELDGVPFDEAMEQILDPVGLTYRIEDNIIVLYYRSDGDEEPAGHPGPKFDLGANKDRKVALKPPFSGWNPDKSDPEDRISAIDAVIAICRQANIQFDFEKSFDNTAPLCRQYVEPDFEDVPWAEAMEEILDPLGLAHTIEHGKVVLTRR